MVRYCIGKTPIYLASRIQRFRQESKIPSHILCNIYALYQHIYTYVKSKLRAILFIHIRAHAREGRRPQNRSVSQRGVTEIVCKKTESMANKKSTPQRHALLGDIGQELLTWIVALERAICIKNNHSLCLFSANLQRELFVDRDIFLLRKTR